MPNISNEQYQAYLAREAARAARKRGKAGAGAAGVPAAKPERDEGVPLVKAPARKAESGPCFEIVFTVYACLPADWDNYHTKLLQDLLIKAGILHDDGWRVLQGRVVSKKASSRKEERTEIIVTPIIDSFGPYGPDGDAKWSGPYDSLKRLHL